jgi:hypothetical protein
VVKIAMPSRRFVPSPGLGAAKVELGAFAFACAPKGYVVSHRALYAGLIEFIVNRHPNGADAELPRLRGNSLASETQRSRTTRG